MRSGWVSNTALHGPASVDVPGCFLLLAQRCVRQQEASLSFGVQSFYQSFITWAWLTFCGICQMIEVNLQPLSPP